MLNAAENGLALKAPPVCHDWVCSGGAGGTVLLLLLLLLPSALPQSEVGSSPAALLCDSLIDSAKRCNFCPAAVAAHAACIERRAAEMRLLKGGTRRELCRHGTFEYSVYDIFVGRSLGAYGEFSEVEWSDVLEPALVRRHRGGQNAGVDRERESERQAGIHVDAGPVGFDVGANIGVFTVPMARVARAHRGRVVAIEADAANHALLRTNIALNRPAADLGGREGQATVTLLHAAAGATPRPSVHMQPRDSPATSSLRQRLGNFGSPELSQTVERVSIDQIMAREGLTQCDVLKLDVEGNELAVLRGAVATVSRYKPVLYVENDRYSTAVLECPLRAMCTMRFQ
jgi:FkbM family methyltransferase